VPCSKIQLADRDDCGDPQNNKGRPEVAIVLAEEGKKLLVAEGEIHTPSNGWRNLTTGASAASDWPVLH
jgi:hypothetical protein